MTAPVLIPVEAEPRNLPLPLPLLTAESCGLFMTLSTAKRSISCSCLSSGFFSPISCIPASRSEAVKSPPTTMGAGVAAPPKRDAEAKPEEEEVEGMMLVDPADRSALARKKFSRRRESKLVLADRRTKNSMPRASERETYSCPSSDQVSWRDDPSSSSSPSAEPKLGKDGCCAWRRERGVSGVERITRVSVGSGSSAAGSFKS